MRVLDAQGQQLLVSCGFNAQGRLVDQDGKVLYVEKALGPWEAHHDLVTRTDEVQVYEQVMGGTDGVRTPSILGAATHLKDNRLLPVGYSVDHESHALTAAAGVDDANFRGGSDRVSYRVDLAVVDPRTPGTYTLAIELDGSNLLSGGPHPNPGPRA